MPASAPTLPLVQPRGALARDALGRFVPISIALHALTALPWHTIVLALFHLLGVHSSVTWKEGVDGAIRDLDNMVTQKHVAKADCQGIFQAIGDNNRNTLAMKIMTEMAKDLPGIEQSAFWAPSPNYPSQ